MEKAVRRIGVFTSGGDAPGMNAAIRAVVRTSLHMGIECVGIRRGYHGLINGDFTKLTFESVSDLSRRGGTMLYSARSEEFRGRPVRRKQRPPVSCWAWRALSASAATAPSAVFWSSPGWESPW